MSSIQNDETYSLKDLCRETQVTERTVRYYIQEGLLPPPRGAGIFARYDRNHLLRLRLIRRLKEEYLPLAEIRRRMAALDPQELETLALQTNFTNQYDEEEADAKNYLDNLLNKRKATSQSYISEQQTVYKPMPPGAAPKPVAPLPAPVTMPMPEAETSKQSSVETKQDQIMPFVPLPNPTETRKRSAAQAIPAETEGETWQRVTLADGVELHYQPRHPEQRKRIARLLEQAKQIFNQ